MTRLVQAMIVALALVAAACSDDATSEQATNGDPSARGLTAVADGQVEPSEVPTAEPEATPTSMPTATAVPPTPTPVPSPTPTPTPVPSPAPTPTPVDTTPVVIQGDGWAITEADVGQMLVFIEQTHQLEFTEEVAIAVSADIGAEFAPGYEAFSENEWFVLQALGLVDRLVERESINQARRDRIRGLCCQYNGLIQVVVKVEATKLETGTVLVHELTHALHRQHQDLFGRSGYETDETPRPFSASIEGVAQFVAFQYFAKAPEDQQREARPELVIIRDDMVPLVGRAAADHLNFAYGIGPVFVEAVVEARGVDGLFDLLANPPTTTEQILFPEKYLLGEGQHPVPAPSAPAGQPVRATGTIGVALLTFLLDPVYGDAATRELVNAWAGDQYVVYETDEQLCLTANIAIETSIVEQSRFADALIAGLAPMFPAVDAFTTPDLIELKTCPL